MLEGEEYGEKEEEKGDDRMVVIVGLSGGRRSVYLA